MSNLLTNVVTIRGVAYTVSEINGKVMRTTRQLIKDNNVEVEGFVAFHCCVEPKWAKLDEALAAPHAILKAISEEAFRLSQVEAGDGEAKND